MADRFFEQPILNSPYECPAQHWELAADGQPTNQLVLKRRRAEFITPIPKPKKQRQAKGVQKELILSSLEGLSTDVQQYDPNPVIAFKLRERLSIAAGTRKLLQGHGPNLETLETEGQMLQRVMPELNVLVINDEAHHCYREKPQNDDLKGEEKDEAKKNNEAARLWISGIEMVKRLLDVNRVFDTLRAKATEILNNSSSIAINAIKGDCQGCL
jgi:hypothetical protein